MFEEEKAKAQQLKAFVEKLREAAKALPTDGSGTDQATQAIVAVGQALREEMELTFAQYRKDMDANFAEQRKQMRETAMWQWVICIAVVLAAVAKEIYL